MSDTRRLPLDQAWDAVRRMALHEEAERVESLGREELAREVAATGRDPAAERAKAMALVAKYRGQGGRSAAVVALPAVAPRSRTLLWLIAAALSVAASVLYLERAAVVAWVQPLKRQREPILPDDQGSVRVAAGLRDQAARACGEELWGLCGTKLDEAKALDPAGESGEAVKAMRATISDRTSAHPPHGTVPEDKGPPPGQGGARP